MRASARAAGALGAVVRPWPSCMARAGDAGSVRAHNHRHALRCLPPRLSREQSCQPLRGTQPCVRTRGRATCQHLLSVVTACVAGRGRPGVEHALSRLVVPVLRHAPARVCWGEQKGFQATAPAAAGAVAERIVTVCALRGDASRLCNARAGGTGFLRVINSSGTCSGGLESGTASPAQSAALALRAW